MRRWLLLPLLLMLALATACTRPAPPATDVVPETATTEADQTPPPIPPQETPEGAGQTSPPPGAGQSSPEEAHPKPKKAEPKRAEPSEPVKAKAQKVKKM